MCCSEVSMRLSNPSQLCLTHFRKLPPVSSPQVFNSQRFFSPDAISNILWLKLPVVLPVLILAGAAQLSTGYDALGPFPGCSMHLETTQVWNSEADVTCPHKSLAHNCLTGDDWMALSTSCVSSTSRTTVTSGQLVLRHSKVFFGPCLPNFFWHDSTQGCHSGTQRVRRLSSFLKIYKIKHKYHSSFWKLYTFFMTHT